MEKISNHQLHNKGNLLHQKCPLLHNQFSSSQYKCQSKNLQSKLYYPKKTRKAHRLESQLLN